MSPVLSAISAVIIISLISIILIWWLISRIPQFSRFSLPLVGLAVGSLLGDAFIHILPEANLRLPGPVLVPVLVIAGMLLFFSIEKFIRWHHCHDPECHDEDNASIVPISLVGESVHNFIDGVVIAAAFLISFPIGLATALAVLIHEIPHEISHFGIYINQGMSLTRSLSLNLFCALFSLLGTVIALIIGADINNFAAYILPATAGGFIYLAAADLIPELHRHEATPDRSAFEIIMVIIGVLLMLSLLYLE